MEPIRKGNDLKRQGESGLIRLHLLIPLIMSIFAAESVFALTCEECREIEKNVSLLQRELKEKDNQLKDFFNKREFKKINEIQQRVDEITKELIKLKSSNNDCTDACKPDMIKKMECRKLCDEIVEMEGKPDSDSDAAKEKIDARYRELANCNAELEKLIKQSKR